MHIDDQTDTFQYELAKLIYRFKREYDLNDYTIAGCLDFAKLSVLTETDDVIFTGELTTEDTDEEEDTDDDHNDIYPTFKSLRFDGCSKRSSCYTNCVGGGRDARKARAGDGR